MQAGGQSDDLMGAQGATVSSPSGGTTLPIPGESLPALPVPAGSLPNALEMPALLAATPENGGPQLVATGQIASTTSAAVLDAVAATQSPVPPTAAEIIQDLTVAIGRLERAGRAGAPSRELRTDAALLGPTSGTAVSASPAGPTPSAPGLPTDAVPRPMLSEVMAQQLVHMVQHGSHAARLHVHPAHLGSIDIKLKVDSNEAHVTLSCTHPAVRDALESAVPRLRDLLGDVGLNLTHVDVEARGQQQGQAERFTGGTPNDSASSVEAVAAVEPAARVMRASLPIGLIDTFA